MEQSKEVKKQPYRGCKNINCEQCIHYWKFATVATMQGLCYNNKNFFEPKNKIK